MTVYSCSPSLFYMAYWNPSICRQEDLPVQHVLLRKWGDGLSSGHLPNSLASLLKANGYNHAPLYVGTWGPFGRHAPLWCVQVMLYKKQLSYGVCVVQHSTTLHPRLPSMLEFKMLLINPDELFVKNFEISIASGLVKRRRDMCGKLRIFKHGRGFRRERSKHYNL
jgi:hypothetical protein